MLNDGLYERFGRPDFALALHSDATLEAGKVADLLVLDANPLEDVGNVGRLSGVMARGRWVPRFPPHPGPGVSDCSVLQ